jgi:ribosomal protein L27
LAGAVTSIDSVPAVVIREAGTAAVSCVGETNVVVKGLPFQVTAVELVNPLPLAVRMKAAPPAVTLVGEMLVRVSEPRIVKGRKAGCGDPVTLTATVSGVVNRIAGTSAVSCVEETKLVVSTVPFQMTCVPPPLGANRKPDPFTVSVKDGLPAGAEFGEMLVSVIVCAEVMGKINAFDTRLPLCAEIDAVPCSAIRLAGTVAVICVALTTVVESAVPFHRR